MRADEGDVCDCAHVAGRLYVIEVEVVCRFVLKNEVKIEVEIEVDDMYSGWESPSLYSTLPGTLDL